MIIDSLKNKDLYTSSHPGFKAAFEFISRAMNENLPDGKHPVEGETYAIVQSYTPNDNNHLFEAHREYIDIQFILEGAEYMEWASLEDATVTRDYDADKDCGFYSVDAAAGMTLTKGVFAVFFPQDAHNPGNCTPEKPAVKKIIVKVKC